MCVRARARIFTRSHHDRSSALGFGNINGEPSAMLPSLRPAAPTPPPLSSALRRQRRSRSLLIAVQPVYSI